MLIHPTVERLRSLGLSAMADAVIELQTNAEAADLPHADWLGLLTDREVTCRDNRRFARRLQVAKLRQAASVENVDDRTPRGLDRALFQSLATSQWLREHHHVAITGPTGTGKSWLACALWGTAPVATASRSSTNAPRACLPIWLKPAARDGSRA